MARRIPQTFRVDDSPITAREHAHLHAIHQIGGVPKLMGLLEWAIDNSPTMAHERLIAAVDTATVTIVRYMRESKSLEPKEYDEWVESVHANAMRLSKDLASGKIAPATMDVKGAFALAAAFTMMADSILSQIVVQVRIEEETKKAGR
jgi:hypothetical protein